MIRNFSDHLLYYYISMNRDDVLKWFKETAIPIIENNHGLFSTMYYVYEDDYNDLYSYIIGYQPYSCGVEAEYGCNDCLYRTSRGDCGEYHLYINENNTIYYEGSDKTYTEEQFIDLLNEFY